MSPVAKHTLMPFTSTDPAFRIEPEALANPSHTVEVAAENEPSVNESEPSVVAPTTVNVEVTVDELPMNPPYNCSVVVANEPRADTLASVSDSVGQFVPVCKHTC